MKYTVTVTEPKRLNVYDVEAVSELAAVRAAVAKLKTSGSLPADATNIVARIGLRTIRLGAPKPQATPVKAIAAAEQIVRESHWQSDFDVRGNRIRGHCSSCGHFGALNRDGECGKC